MGARNVKSAFANWPQLRDGPMRLLVFMALTALDTDAEPQYWGGRDALAIALGRLPKIANAPTPEDEARQRAAAYLGVKRALRALKDAGAITPLNFAGPGERSLYRLNLDGPPRASERPSVGDIPRTPRSGVPVPVDKSVRGVPPMNPTQTFAGYAQLPPAGVTSSTPSEGHPVSALGVAPCTPKE